MASNIKRPIKIFNGTDWDKILPEISEDQIKSGWVQSNNGNVIGHRKLPGGFKIQAGYVGGVSAANGAWVTFPEAFTTAVLAVVTCGNGTSVKTWAANVALNKFALLCDAQSDIFWIAVGI